MAGSIQCGMTATSQSCWSFWIDHILKQRDTLGMKKAAFISASTGAVMASSNDWRFSSSDIASLTTESDQSLSRSRDSLRYDGKTYVIKSQESGQIVAFNGRSYLIITRSKTIYMVSLCQSRAKSTQAAAWMRQLRNKLVEKNY